VTLQDDENRNFVYQFLDFWRCDAEFFPPHVSDKVQTLIIEARSAHIMQSDVFHVLSTVLAEIPNPDEQLLLNIVAKMFANGVLNWGRLVAVFAFSMELIEYSRANELKEVYDAVPAMLLYTLKEAEQWIMNEGGWETFVKICKKM
jgi:hypothetical protein